MIAETLNNNPLFQLLLKRDTLESQAYVGLLRLVESPVSSALEYVKTIFPEYTPHDFAHSLRVLSHIGQILSVELCEELSDTELFCLIIAAFFHDIGMIIPGKKDLIDQRKYHHIYAREPLEAFFKEYLTVLPEHQRFLNCISFVCEAHGMDLDEFFHDSRYLQEDMIQRQRLRYNLLAELLRIGDLLDMDESRAEPFMLKHYSDYYPEESQVHQEHHLHIESYVLEPDRIEVHVLAENIQEYRLWEVWLHYLEADILHANTHLMPKLRRGFYLPELEYQIGKAPDSDYETETLRFELTETGAIWNILSQSVYTQEYDFVREVVQNGIDAVLMREYLDESMPLNVPSPRFWDAWQKTGRVVVAYSEREGVLLVSDNGTGMDKNALTQFLFRIADSGYRHQAQTRDFPFPAIAKFGIGFISCLTKAQQVVLFTYPGNGAPGYRARLFSDSVRAYFETLPSNGERGTTIYIKLKNEYPSQEIYYYLLTCFQYPSVPVEWLELDALEHMLDRFKREGELSADIALPAHYLMPWHEFENIYSDFRAVQEPLYRRECDIADKLTEAAETLEEESEAFEEEYHDRTLNRRRFEKRLAMLVRRLSCINAYVDTCRYTSNILTSSKACKDDTQWEKNAYELIEQLRDGKDALYQEIQRHRESQAQYEAPRTIVGHKALRNYLECGVCVTTLTECFEVIKFHELKDKEHMRGQGVLFVPCSFDDPSLGIEWRSVHIFFFKGPQLYHTLNGEISAESTENTTLGIMELEDIADMFRDYSFDDLVSSALVELPEIEGEVHRRFLESTLFLTPDQINQRREVVIAHHSDDLGCLARSQGLISKTR